ncbi:PAS domain-containing sensor histidine kinase [Robbsia andropogonis]|nr:PAS domain-containing sensor histidine kinase [Robbsia andropogonis]
MASRALSALFACATGKKRIGPTFLNMLNDLSAFDILIDAYLVLDDRYHVIAANARYCVLTCQTRADIIGRSIYEINQHGTPTEREGRDNLLTGLFARLQFIETAETSPLVYPLPGALAASEPRYWKIFANKRKLSRRSGIQETCYILRLQDVTVSYLQEIDHRKQQAILRSKAQLRQRLALDAQRQSETDTEALKEALSFARVGAWTLDLNTGIIDCTVQCKANYGMPSDYLMTNGNLLNELIDPVDRDRVRLVLEDALERRGSFDVEYRTTWPSGETRWVMVRGKFPESEDGTSNRLSGFSLDITARKILELENEQRMKAEVDARRASEDRVNSIDTFVSAVSHELRSPLNAIGSWAQLLDRPDHIALSKAADVIKRNVRQLSSMVEDLLDTGAVINGKLNVSLKPIDLMPVAKSVVEDVRLNVEAKGLALETHFEASCMILGDETRLRQVFFNLLTNAIKFTDRGVITVSLAITEKTARFLIHDTGIGIGKDTQSRIFDRFNQAASIGTERAGGLGLGLWIANTIVAAHHGTLLVESDGAGHGSTFVVELPRKQV